MHLHTLPWKVYAYETLLGLITFVPLIVVCEALRSTWLHTYTTWIITIEALLTLAFLTETLIGNLLLLRTFALKISEDRFTLQKGRFFFTETTVCNHMIIGVEVREGPILRLFGLARIAVKTVGYMPDIPPLPVKDAQHLREKLLHSIEKRDAELEYSVET